MKSQQPNAGIDRPIDDTLTHRSLIVVGIVVSTIILLVLFWYVVDVLLLVFASILIAILLRAPADWVAQRTPVTGGWSLAVVILLIVTAVGLGGWLFGANVADQAGQLVNRLPALVTTVQERVQQYDWLVEHLRPRRLLGSESQFIGRGLSAISTTFGALANIAIILLMAVFFAAQPRLYVQGLLRLLPHHHRPRTHQVLSEIGHILRRWLIGQLLLMLMVAVLTTIGLWLLGVQFALALGILSGLLTFIPYLGPVLSVIPAALVALAQGPALAGYVVLLYVGVQILQAPVEPIVQQRAVFLPPALVIIAQVISGVLLGPLGVMLATPLAAAALVATRSLYVEDVLGDNLAS